MFQDKQSAFTVGSIVCNERRKEAEREIESCTV